VRGIEGGRLRKHTLTCWIEIKNGALFQKINTMAPRYEICAGLEKGHKSTKNTLKVKFYFKRFSY